MARPVLFVAGAVPAILAIAIGIPLLTKPDIPYGALEPSDVIELEYTKSLVQKIPHQITERTAVLQTEILTIDPDGSTRYVFANASGPLPATYSDIAEDDFRALAALIKETGFMAIPGERFVTSPNATEWQKYSVKVTLNGATTQIHWPEPNATSGFVPPIITMVGEELDGIIETLHK